MSATPRTDELSCILAKTFGDSEASRLGFVKALNVCENIEVELTSTTARLAEAEQLLENALIAINAGDDEWTFVKSTLEAITKFLSTKP